MRPRDPAAVADEADAFHQHIAAGDVIEEQPVGAVLDHGEIGAEKLQVGDGDVDRAVIAGEDECTRSAIQDQRAGARAVGGGARNGKLDIHRPAHLVGGEGDGVPAVRLGGLEGQQEQDKNEQDGDCFHDLSFLGETKGRQGNAGRCATPVINIIQEKDALLIKLS